jgi:hypothetical protein
VGHDIVQDHGGAPQSPDHAPGESQGQAIGE